MPITKVFMSGDSQAVRIPKEFRFDESEVFIEKVEGGVLLRPAPKDKWALAREALMNFSDDMFIDGRQQPPMQERPELEKLFE